MKVNVDYGQVKMEIDCTPEEFSKVMELIKEKVVLTIKHECSFNYNNPYIYPNKSPYEYVKITCDGTKI